MATATSPGRAGRLPVPPSPDHDWPAQAADTIERAVGVVFLGTGGVLWRRRRSPGEDRPLQ